MRQFDYSMPVNPHHLKKHSHIEIKLRECLYNYAIACVNPMIKVIVIIDNNVEAETSFDAVSSSLPNLIANIVVDAAIGALADTMHATRRVPL